MRGIGCRCKDHVKGSAGLITRFRRAYADLVGGSAQRQPGDKNACNASAARATGAARKDATANPAVISKTVVLRFMTFLPLVSRIGG
jgi:hypothetical protein